MLVMLVGKASHDPQFFLLFLLIAVVVCDCNINACVPHLTIGKKKCVMFENTVNETGTQTDQLQKAYSGKRE